MKQLSNRTISLAEGVVINEWLPNPVGRDSEGEWLELYNAGGSPVSLSGWQLDTGGRSKHTLSGSLTPGEYLLVERSESKLPLRNTGGELFLYDAGGTLRDSASFPGTAPEGKSFSRLENGFFFANPTPKAKNKATQTQLVEQDFSYGANISESVTGSHIFAMMIGAGLLLAGVVLYIIIHHETFNYLFLRSRDEELGS